MTEPTPADEVPCTYCGHYHQRLCLTDNPHLDCDCLRVTGTEPTPRSDDEVADFAEQCEQLRELAASASVPAQDWRPHFTVHGDPMIVPKGRPWPSSRLADFATDSTDYGRANTLLAATAVALLPQLLDSAAEAASLRAEVARLTEEQAALTEVANHRRGEMTRLAAQSGELSARAREAERNLAASRAEVEEWKASDVASVALINERTEQRDSLQTEVEALRHGAAAFVAERIAPIQSERDRQAAQLRAVTDRVALLGVHRPPMNLRTAHSAFTPAEGWQIGFNSAADQIRSILAAALAGNVPPPAETGPIGCHRPVDLGWFSSPASLLSPEAIAEAVAASSPTPTLLEALGVSAEDQAAVRERLSADFDRIREAERRAASAGQSVVLGASSPTPTLHPGHEHEPWQIRSSSTSGWYCAACGDSVPPPSSTIENTDEPTADVADGG